MRAEGLAAVRRSPLMRRAPALPHLVVSRLDRTAVLPRIAKRRTRYKAAQGVTKPSERGEVRSPGDRQIDIAIEILRDEVCQSERAQGRGRQPRRDGSPGEGHDWNAHPQCIEGRHPAT